MRFQKPRVNVELALGRINYWFKLRVFFYVVENQYVIQLVLIEVMESKTNIHFMLLERFKFF